MVGLVKWWSEHTAGLLHRCRRLHELFPVAVVLCYFPVSVRKMRPLEMRLACIKSNRKSQKLSPMAKIAKNLPCTSNPLSDQFLAARLVFAVLVRENVAIGTFIPLSDQFVMLCIKVSLCL